MKKAIYLSTGIVFLVIIITLFFSMNYSSKITDDPLKILFIGNSYTFSNNLPLLVKKMGIENNKDFCIEIKAFTPAGAKLKDHLNSSCTVDTIRNGNWDIILVQGHSIEPLKNPIGFTEAATDLIRIMNESGADVYLFETWSRQIGNPIYSEAWSGRNPDSMQKQLSMRYHRIAQNLDVTLIPIGSIWQQLIRERQEMELYSIDGSHPTQIGTYLTACIIYRYIFNEDPRNINYVPPAIKETEAKILRQYASIFDDKINNGSIQ